MPANAELIRQCRACGCTDREACNLAGVACCWVDDDLCSACATARELFASPEGAMWWVTVAMRMIERAEAIDAADLELAIEVPVIWTPE